MFSQWLEGNGREPRTWRTLILALGEASLHTIVQELQNIFSGTSSDHAVQTNSTHTGILILLCKMDGLCGTMLLHV